MTAPRTPGIPATPITDKQRLVLDYMRAFFRTNDQLPTHQMLCARFNWTSLNSAAEHCAVLERRGLIERNVLGKFKFTDAGRALGSV